MPQNQMSATAFDLTLKTPETPEQPETRQTQATPKTQFKLPALYNAALIPHANPYDPTNDRNLSHREGEVLAWIAEGKSDWEIGNILLISEKTVNYHAENVKRKLSCRNRLQAAVLAVRLGLIVMLATLELTEILTIAVAALV